MVIHVVLCQSDKSELSWMFSTMITLTTKHSKEKSPSFVGSFNNEEFFYNLLRILKAKKTEPLLWCVATMGGCVPDCLMTDSHLILPETIMAVFCFLGVHLTVLNLFIFTYLLQL